MKVKEYFKIKKKKIEKKLDEYLPSVKQNPVLLHEAMRYSVFSGGKRIRPIMSILGFEVYGGKGEKILPVACAIELIHTYSLIHDDLPVMDNDDFRRGKPSCHKKFGSGVAILVGDVLLIEGFKLLAAKNKSSVVKKLISCVSNKIGSCGMNAGQVADIQRDLKFGNLRKIAKGDKTEFLKQSKYINTHKTAALIEAAFVSGAITAEAAKVDIDKIQEYSYCIGFLFQLVDDILDKDGYVLALGISGAVDEAKKFLKKAKKKAEKIDKKNKLLKELPDYIFQRINV